MACRRRHRRCSAARPRCRFGQREFAAEVAWDLPNLAPGATSLLDVTVNGARQGDLAHAALASSTRFIELDAAAWSNNTVRVMARNISPATFDLGAATLSVQVTEAARAVTPRSTAVRLSRGPSALARSSPACQLLFALMHR